VKSHLYPSNLSGDWEIKAGRRLFRRFPNQDVANQFCRLAYQPNASREFLGQSDIGLDLFGLGEIRVGDVSAKVAAFDLGREAAVKLGAQRE
jgi:hypothetical protein